MNIHAFGADLFLADGRTDMAKLTVAFRNSASWPKKTGNLSAFVQPLL